MKNVDYMYEKELREQQRENEENFLKQFERGEYTFEHPLIVENPYLINPLSALVLFENEDEENVTVTVHGIDDESTLHHIFPGERKQKISILGLYANAETKVTLVKGNVEKVFYFKTDLSKYENVPEVVSIRKKQNFKTDEFMFFSSALRELPYAVDNNGDIRWIYTIAMQWQARLLKNGHLFIGTERQLIQPYYVTGCYEIDFNGKIYCEYKIPDGYHHDFVEMEDGNLLIATDDMESGILEDQVILLERHTGKVLKSWCMRNVLDPKDGLGSKALPDDWFHNNALQYDKSTNSIILSARHIDAIVSIDYDSGKLNWILGDSENWSEKWHKYFFKPVGENFEWFYAQHSCVVVESNHIYCFDNGCARSKNPDKYIQNPDNYSRGVHYVIDTEKMEVRQVWQYGKERGSEFFSMYISNIDPYGDINDKRVLVHSGGTALDHGVAWNREYVPVLIKEATTEPYAYTVEVVDGEVAYELKQKGNYYRAIRMKLYNDDYKNSFGPAEVIGDFYPTISDPCSMYQVESEVPEDKKVRFIERDDSVTFYAYVKMGTDVGILLKSENDRKYYKVETNLRPLVRLIQSGGEVQEGYSIVTKTILKTGLNNKYDVHFVIDGREYAAGFSMEGDIER